MMQNGNGAVAVVFDIVFGMPVDSMSVLVVGDTPRDVEAARYAGAVSIAVASGHFSKEQSPLRVPITFSGLWRRRCRHDAWL